MRYFYFGFLKSLLRSFQSQLGVLIVTGAWIFYPDALVEHLGFDLNFLAQYADLVRLVFYGVGVFFVLNVLGRLFKKSR